METKSDFKNLKRQIEELLNNYAKEKEPDQNKLIDFIIDQFSTYHRELEFQNEELRRIQNQLEKNERYFFSIFDDSPVGYAICNKDGQILKANKTLIAMLNVDFTDVIRHSFTELIAAHSQDDFYLYLRKLQTVSSQVRISLDFNYQNSSREFTLVSSLYNDGTEEFIRIAVV